MKRNDKFDKILFSEEYYDCNNKEILKYQLDCIEEVNKFNNTVSNLENLKLRGEMLKEMFGAIGENSYVEPPIHSNFGCKNCFVGKNFYANFNLTLVDDGKITIGDNVLIGPNCTIITPVHPLDPIERFSDKNQKNLPVVIGNNVWIAANVTIMPGVKIGDNAVIGANSLVTHDVEADSLYYGNPAKFIKKIVNNKD